MQRENIEDVRLIDLKEVVLLTGIRKSKIYADADFPRRIKIGRATRWAHREVLAWINQRIADRDAEIVQKKPHRRVNAGGARVTDEV